TITTTQETHMNSAILSPSARIWLQRSRLLALLLLLFAGFAGASLLASAEPLTPAPAAVQTLDTGESAAEPFGVREMYLQADLVVKSVMIFLALCSLLTWAVLL